jgi:non-heme chloroperoxidase
MSWKAWIAVFALTASATESRAQAAAPEPIWHDSSPHQVRFLAVQKGVRLEILDWGGTGRPIILVTGLTDTAHVFDEFAPKLTDTLHVIGITRRGFGASSAPAKADYSADRLGDDIVAAIRLLKLHKPVLAGHSIAGEELSSVGTRHPESISGLIYLDAAWVYAFDNGKATPLQTYLQLKSHFGNPDLTAADRATFKSLQSAQARVVGVTLPEAEYHQHGALAADGRVRWHLEEQATDAILAGTRRYTDLRVPVLALAAYPQTLGAADANAAADVSTVRRQWQTYKLRDLDNFERSVPGARVVRMRANHYVFISNEAEVLREIRAFVAGLPQ